MKIRQIFSALNIFSGGLYKTFPELHKSFLPLNNSFLPLNKSFLPLNKSFLPLNKTFLELNNSFPELNKSFLPLNKSFPELNKSFLPLNKSFLPLNKTFLPLNKSFLPLNKTFNETKFSSLLRKISLVPVYHSVTLRSNSSLFWSNKLYSFNFIFFSILKIDRVWQTICLKVMPSFRTGNQT